MKYPEAPVDRHGHKQTDVMVTVCKKLWKGTGYGELLFPHTKHSPVTMGIHLQERNKDLVRPATSLQRKTRNTC